MLAPAPTAVAWLVVGASLVGFGLVGTAVAADFENVPGRTASYSENGQTAEVVAYTRSPDVEIFYGLPFAQPPLGELRFQPPQPVRTLPPLINRTWYQPGCMQHGGTSEGYSEDCLYLNVWRPTGNHTDLPVFVWLYGGAFVQGSAQGQNFINLLTAGQNQNKPFIAVTPNYRLGPFGFGYGADYMNTGSANAGLADVVAAMKWVNAHIASFGGDPNRVTLGGSSAGAVAASLMQVVSPILGLPPLAGLWLDSGSAEANPLARATDGFPGVYPQLLNLTGCADRPALPWSSGSSPASAAFECLRASPADVLNRAAQTLRAMRPYAIGFPFNPSVDGAVLPDFPHTLFAVDAFRRIPLVAGDCMDEGTQFVSPSTNSSATVLEQVQYQQAVPFNRTFVEGLMRLYPDEPAVGSPFNMGAEAFGLPPHFKQSAALYGDLGFHSSRRMTLQRQNQAGWGQTWTWLFDGIPNRTPHLGVSHTSDLAYWFSDASDRGDLQGQGVVDMQGTMVGYLLNFIYHSDPNGQSGLSYGGAPYWPKYVEAGQTANMLNFTGTHDASAVQISQDDFRQEQIAYIINNAPLSHQPAGTYTPPARPARRRLHTNGLV